MILSGEHHQWDAHLLRGAAIATLAIPLDTLERWRRRMRALGVTFAEVAERQQRAARAMARACPTAEQVARSLAAGRPRRPTSRFTIHESCTRMSYVVLGVDVFEGDALVAVVESDLSGTTTVSVVDRRVPDGVPRFTLELADVLANQVAVRDGSLWPPVSPFLGRLDATGHLEAIVPPGCMAEEGVRWLSTIAVRDGIPLDEVQQ